MRPFSSSACAFTLTSLALVACSAEVTDEADSTSSASTLDELTFTGGCCSVDPTSPYLSFPADERPHASAPTEWWYWNGNLVDGDGKRYAFIVSFLEGIDAASGMNIHYALAGITDVSANVMHQTELPPELGTYPTWPSGISLSIGTWRGIRDDRGREKVRIETADGVTLELDAKSEKPLVYQYDQGKLDLGAGHANYYYSRMRETYRGTLKINGRTKRVSGDGDFDHQWGDLPPNQRWNWYHTALDNGEELIAYTVFDATTGAPVLRGGVLQGRDCAPVVLKPSDFVDEATGSWTSPVSGKVYPNRFNVSIPSRRLKLTLEPVIADQELHSFNPLSPHFWEGGARVTGTVGGRRVKGNGYIELLGY